MIDREGHGGDKNSWGKRLTAKGKNSWGKIKIDHKGHEGH